MKMVSALLAGVVLATAAVPASAARPSPEAQLAKALKGRVPGKPVNCISLTSVSSSQVIEGQGILYRVGAGRLYLNRPSIGANSLDDDSILVTRTPSTQLCRMDTIHLVDRASGFPRGFVGLGDFVPYTRADKR